MQFAVGQVTTRALIARIARALQRPDACRNAARPASGRVADRSGRSAGRSIDQIGGIALRIERIDMVGRRTACTVVLAEDARFAERIVADRIAAAVDFGNERASVPDVVDRCGTDGFADTPAGRVIAELDRAGSRIRHRRHVPPTIVGQRHAVEGRQVAAGVVAQTCRSGKPL